MRHPDFALDLSSLLLLDHPTTSPRNVARRHLAFLLTCVHQTETPQSFSDLVGHLHSVEFPSLAVASSNRNLSAAEGINLSATIRFGTAPLKDRTLKRLAETSNLDSLQKLTVASLLFLTADEISTDCSERFRGLVTDAVRVLSEVDLKSFNLHHLALLLGFLRTLQQVKPNQAKEFFGFSEVARRIVQNLEVPSLLRPEFDFWITGTKDLKAMDGGRLPPIDGSLANQVAGSVSLAAVMQDLGYPVTGSAVIVKKLLEHMGTVASNAATSLKEEDIARVLGMMARTTSGSEASAPSQGLASTILKGADLAELQKMTTWDVETFTSVVSEMRPDLNWFAVMRGLDYPDFMIYDTQGLGVILNASKIIVKDMFQFPITAFFGRWTNEKGQLSFLKHAIQAAPELFSLNQIATRRVVTLDGANNAARLIIPALGNQAWNSLDLIETLVGLSDGALHEDVKAIFESASQQSPELILLGFAQLSIPWNNLLNEMTPSLVMLFLTGHQNSNFVLPKLWQTNQSLAVSGLLHLYSRDPSSLSRILDVAQEMKALSQILETKPFSFSIDLAALASRRDYLNLEKWLQDHIREEGNLFIKACLDFLNEKVTSQILRQETSTVQQSVPLSVDVVAIFLRILHSHSGTMSAENSDFLKEIFSTCLQAYPRLINLTSTVDESPSGEGTTFSEDVEEEVNSYYEKMYKGEMSIAQIVDLLQRFKASTNAREQDIYKCMIHNLFDEYKFFRGYPPTELAITSVLFGALIQNQIVTGLALGMALRYVLDALRQPVDSKLFVFGIQALLQFQPRLGEWPQYSSLLLQIEHLHEARPGIVQYIQTLQSQTPAGASGQEPSNAESGWGFTAQPTSEAGRPAEAPVFTALKPDTLLDAADKDHYEVPNEATQDKILFIINNVSSANMEAKNTEMKTILKEAHYRWFSHYIVVKRASIEPNFHSLYISFLDALESKSLQRNILHETYLNIRILLNSEKTVTSSQERSLLKNLGTWLGGITLAKNKPIKHKNLAVKGLLLEGYDSNRLIVVIPFVCKVLEQAKGSKVFKPPNPWLMAIMKLLAELYHYADLKLNLKFEIEVLCKNIRLDITDIQPTSLLRDRPQKEASETAEMFKNFDKLPVTTTTASIASSVGAGIGAAHGGSMPANLSAAVMPSQTTVATQPGLARGDEVGIPNLASYITFNPNLPIFSAQPSLKRIVHIAIDRAIQEIISPVVERSVTIAGIATRELVVKDFALEPDEGKVGKAAHLMVQSLAGSLAAVSSREPLRVSMMSHLRSLLVQNGFTEQTMPEQAVYIIVGDNLDLACSVMEKAASEKAIPEIDDALHTAYHNRRKHRERTGQPYYDMQIYAASRYPSTLPEPLRLKPGGLTLQQFRVYEDFARIARAPPASQAEANERAGRPVVTRPDGRQENMPMFGGPGMGAYEDANAPLSIQPRAEKFAQLVVELDKQVQQNGTASLATLPAQHEVRNIINQITLLAAQAFNTDEAALIFSQKVVQLLYKNESDFSREVYVHILGRLCELSKRLAKEVKEWLLYHDDERKYNVPITVAIIQAQLLSVPELDMQLARLMESGRGSIVDFTAKLIHKCLLEEPHCATQNDFFNCIEILNKLAQRGKVSDSVTEVLEGLKAKASSLSIEEFISRGNETGGLREQLAVLFTDWVRIYHHPASNEKSHAAYIGQLQQSGILKADSISPLFFRVCTEISVDSYINARATQGAMPVLPFQAVDAFARLIVLLVRYHTDPAGIDHNHARANLAVKILSIIVLVLVHSHEQRKVHFNQRPFFRLFSTLLNDLNTFEEHLQPIYIQIFSTISKTFHTLQPCFLPGFAFSWLQLISHRFFMPKLLLAEDQKFWPFFQRLLVDLFKFLGPFLRNPEMTETTRLLYKATLRILLVLLHDFPEFLADYHFSFVDVIPHSCIQLRNLILSAFPRNMRLPDPFTPNLKVDLLPEINQPPRVLSDYTGNLLANNFKQDVDTYLRTRSPVSFLVDIRNRLLLPAAAQAEAGTKYNVPAINALVLYVGVQAIMHPQNRPLQGPAPITHSAPMDIFQQLVVDLDTEGRYLFLSAIANQLRYPNSHTHYFSCVLLYLFAEANQEVIQEQITRVLIERLIVNRPHPYGLLITFIELIRNPRYNFWDHTNFIRCSPEIERLFSSVAKSINQSLMRVSPIG
ncbi:hypothetical protein HK104_005661 [Borealophlyctis nickersoniae]|nr:hypothetical protein HK104_005661 [Borealophlyctis nickersoniae]